MRKNAGDRQSYIQALEALTDDRLTVEELIRMTMRTGETAIAVMKKLDEANTQVYGNPSPHKVNIHMKKGPFIIVSGHDLKDLEMLLEQTKGKGINIYIPTVRCCPAMDMRD